MPQLMTSPSRRLRAGLLVGLVALVPAVAACGVNKGAETDQERTVLGAAVNGTVGSIKIQDASIIPAGDTTPVARVSSSSATQTTPAVGYLDVVITNDGKTPDTFTGVQVGNVTATLTPGSSVTTFTLQPGQELRFADPTTDPSGVLPSIQLAGSPLPAVGTMVPTTFAFANAGGSAQLQIPVSSESYSTATSQPVPGVSGPQTLAPEDETTEPTPTGSAGY